MKISIVKGNIEGQLVLEVEDKPNNGHSRAPKGEIVDWKVKPGIEVKCIHNIEMKKIVGSVDVFSSNPPQAQNNKKTYWKGIINSDAEDFSVYVYKIDWEHINGSIKTFDPIISIKPSVKNLKQLIPFIAGSLLTLLINFLGKKKK